MPLHRRPRGVATTSAQARHPRLVGSRTGQFSAHVCLADVLFVRHTLPVLSIVGPCERELADWPDDVRGDLADAIARLERGHMLAMPLSRPMPSVGSGVHELRFRDRSGIYRVIYWLAGAGTIWLLHAFQKTTQKTPPQSIQVAKDRLKKVKP